MVRLGAWIGLLGVLLACSGDDDSGSSGTAGEGGGSGSSSGSSGSGSSGNGGSTTTGGGGIGPGTDGTNVLALCDTGACACEDGVDNDSDGELDGFDTECTGPNDDDEGTFATGIPGDNQDPHWQDCFFDGNSGAGDDMCRYHTDCLTGGAEATSENCSVTDQCVDFCAPRTPNGCDCFGCCSVTGPDGVSHDVIISIQCDAEHIEDCESCVKTDQCGNTCGECELCPGKTVEDLPDSCTPDVPDAGTPTYGCEGGADMCRTTADCGPGYYCGFGCCTVIPPD
jgi:hypothetical protein